ncbi:hypothetical protein [Chroococcidiopsis sp. CCMEE 29]|uniref:hypothetical protein n=1 Tax=Chroococcidiopsis sp. CCMEE 29 TaxID=155894 RepID=UPI0020223771|nr:hypothetical protein [Chroococcidiopsis sp. CCMEE 29]
MTYAQVELQTVEAHGIPCTEYHYQPEDEQLVELGNTQYITAIKEPEKPRNRYLATLLNRFTGQEQRVDVVIQESGFTAMIAEIRKHFGSSWEIFSWTDCDAPF